MENPTFPDSDDDNLLLDDENTTVCITGNMGNGHKTGKYCRINNTGALIDSTSAINIHSDEQLDSPEDSPLLRADDVKNFGQLSIKDFHCHTYKDRQEQSQAYRTLWLVSLLCFLFMVIEIVGGYIAGSLAVMTDAAHLFSDLVGFSLSIISIWISRKPPTPKMTFGYYRAEVIGAFFSVIAVWFLAITFCILAVDKIIKKEYNINVNTMLIISGLGLAINMVQMNIKLQNKQFGLVTFTKRLITLILSMGAVLHGFCANTHTHSHNAFIDHSHTNNINIRAAAAHVIGDLLQSLGVLIAAVVIKLFPSAQIADPICTILFSVIVVITTLRVAKDSIHLLVEASPRCTKEINNLLKTIQGVQHVHSLHLWSLAPGKEALSTHLAVDEQCDRDDVLSEATFLVKKNLNIVSCTIQIELYDHEQVNTCSECQTLQW